MDPDGDFLFKLRNILVEPRLLLFRRSLDSGIFPSIVKLDSIKPILKSVILSGVTNYRPITILSHFSKLFGTLVFNSIRSPIYHIHVGEQYGFHLGRSTVTCNLILYTYIFYSFHANYQADIIYTDFDKAFVHVNHSKLISSLDNISIVEPFFS